MGESPRVVRSRRRRQRLGPGRWGLWGPVLTRPRSRRSREQPSPRRDPGRQHNVLNPALRPAPGQASGEPSGHPRESGAWGRGCSRPGAVSPCGRAGGGLTAPWCCADRHWLLHEVGAGGQPICLPAPHPANRRRGRRDHGLYSRPGMGPAVVGWGAQAGLWATRSEVFCG